MTEDGFVLNDEMDDFGSPGSVNSYGYAASPANYIRGGKRPQSSISSTIVVDEQENVVLAIGAAGGSRIISSVLQTIQGHLDYQTRPIDLQRSTRWHDQLTNVTEIEDSTGRIKPFDQAALVYLQEHGYNITSGGGAYVQSASIALVLAHLAMVARNANDGLAAAADVRLVEASAAAY